MPEHGVRHHFVAPRRCEQDQLVRHLLEILKTRYAPAEIPRDKYGQVRRDQKG